MELDIETASNRHHQFCLRLTEITFSYTFQKRKNGSHSHPGKIYLLQQLLTGRGGWTIKPEAFLKHGGLDGCNVFMHDSLQGFEYTYGPTSLGIMYIFMYQVLGSVNIMKKTHK